MICIKCGRKLSSLQMTLRPKTTTCNGCIYQKRVAERLPSVPKLLDLEQIGLANLLAFYGGKR